MEILHIYFILSTMIREPVKIMRLQIRESNNLFLTILSYQKKTYAENFPILERVYSYKN